MSSFSALKRSLDAHDLPYNVPNDGVIEIYDKRENIGSVRVVIIFNEKGPDRPALRCYDLGKFPKEKIAAALIACNNANKQFRWVKFSIDEDNDIVASIDAIVNEESVYDEILELIIRMMNIVNDAYPSFMQARWA